MLDNSDSITRTTESGAFIRTTIRKGKKRHQDTKRIKKNDKKVILGNVGDFEVYVYPYDFPDTVFIGTFPVSTQISTENVNQLIGAYNRAKAYLEGNYFNKPNWRKATNSRRRAIKKAYNMGLNDSKKPK
jgi:hypothetical protein